MNASRTSPLPSAHPVATLGELLVPHERPRTRALLFARPGLSLSYNARGALFEAGCELAASAMDRTEVLVPAFHCPSAITPLIEAGLSPVFYRIDRELGIDFEDLLAKVGPRTRAVMVIHFFGFEYELAALQPLRDRGIALIEDWSHSFLRAAPLGLPRPQGDFQVYSFWKLVPSDVGGGLMRVSGPDAEPWFRPKTSMREAVVRFKRNLEEVLAHSPHRRSHRAFQALEHWRLRGRSGAPEAPLAAPAAPERGEDHYSFDPLLARAGIPPRARRMILGTDLAALADRRRANYAIYAQRLNRNDALRPLRPELDAATCPWVFPVLLRDRDQIDRQWRAAGVALHTFGIWLHSGVQAADPATRHDAEWLASELLCLSVHQGLGVEGIEASVGIINSFLGQARRA